MQCRYEWGTGNHPNLYHHVHASPVSSVNVASGQVDVPDQAVDLMHKFKSLPVYQLS
jgi:hypothetical protein